MIKGLFLTSNEKKLFLAACVVVGLLITTIVVHSCMNFWSGMEKQKVELKQEWNYSSAILARASAIEEKDSFLRSRYPKLFENSSDTTRSMAELDSSAKAAGVQVDMIRPIQQVAKNSDRYEMSVRGSWVQFMKFLTDAESSAHIFEFSKISIHRQNPTGELLVSAEVERLNFR
ncbi:MAG: hypothetical protein HQL19_00985 [Candidatus Omnitrophica bacterium]|nr:hypothetical protein [Candidatus Omnitrophota bacterium]